MQKIVEGTWKALDFRRAFVEGAKWWEFQKTGATMWQSDRDLTEQEAEKRWGAAQQSVHLTAYGRGVWLFCAGFVAGLLACLAVIGGR